MYHFPEKIGQVRLGHWWPLITLRDREPVVCDELSGDQFSENIVIDDHLHSSLLGVIKKVFNFSPNKVI